MKAMRLVVLLLLAILLLGPALPASPAAAENRQIRKTSGPLSVCALNWTGERFKSNTQNMHYQSWQQAKTLTVQDGQLYSVRVDLHTVSQWLDYADDLRTVYHAQADMRLYAGPDPALATGWYETQYVEKAIFDGGGYPLMVGHLTGQGYGDFAGQTVQGTLAVGEWFPENSLCSPTNSAWFNATMILRFVGKP